MDTPEIPWTNIQVSPLDTHAQWVAKRVQVDVWSKTAGLCYTLIPKTNWMRYEQFESLLFRQLRDVPTYYTRGTSPVPYEPYESPADLQVQETGSFLDG